jgi:hypothetical protein
MGLKNRLKNDRPEVVMIPWEGFWLCAIEG